jgi:hypothetical protein
MRFSVKKEFNSKIEHEETIHSVKLKTTDNE